MTLDSNCNKMTYCGEKQQSGGYIFQSCDNNLTIQYKSSNSDQFRGFNLYYEVTVNGTRNSKIKFKSSSNIF